MNARSASILLHDLEEIPPVDGPIDEIWGFGFLSSVRSMTQSEQDTVIGRLFLREKKPP